jgi:hypothetical protein
LALSISAGGEDPPTEHCFAFSRAWLKKMKVDRWDMVVSAAVLMR